jgi:chromosome segregation ATPase
MTPTRYFLARVAQTFGFLRRNQRLGNAASEMHLLREAEAQLGEMVWEQVEGIEALSIEYWNLRKLIKERELTQAKLVACQEVLDLAHEQRTILLNSTPEMQQELFDERSILLNELEILSHQRDQIVSDAREVRRSYIGHKMKLEVLSKEVAGTASSPKAIEAVKTRLNELRARFSELKEKRIRLGEQIEQGDEKINLVDAKIQQKKQERRAEAAAAFQIIGEGNRQLSIMRAESALLDTRMRQLFGEIGRHVSRHDKVDPACAVAAASRQGLVDVMRALRRSIALNHRLTN